MKSRLPADPRGRLRDRYLPGPLWLAAAMCFAWFGWRAWRGLPTAAEPSRGDFEHFYFAALAMTRGEDIYASHTHGYIYPPLLAALLRPLTALDQRPAQLVWAAINGVLTCGILALAWRIAAKRLRLPRDQLTKASLVLGALLLTIDQARWEFEEGQTDTLVILGMVAALAALDRRPLLAGLCAGFAVNIKYQAVILAPYFLLRGRYRAAAASLAGAVAWALLPALACGWRRNTDYLGAALGGVGRLIGGAKTGGPVAPHTIRWEKSVSVPSAVARALGTEQEVGMASIYAVVAMVALLVVIAATWAYWRRGVPLLAGRGGEAEQTPLLRAVVLLEWAGLVVAVLAFSPQSMVRHGFILLPVNMAAVALVLVPRMGVARWPLVLGIAVYQLGTRLPPGNVEAYKPALDLWQAVGGSTWCMLLMYMSMLWVGLGYARAVAERRPLADPPPGYERL